MPSIEYPHRVDDQGSGRQIGAESWARRLLGQVDRTTELSEGDIGGRVLIMVANGMVRRRISVAIRISWDGLYGNKATTLDW